MTCLSFAHVWAKYRGLKVACHQIGIEGSDPLVVFSRERIPLCAQETTISGLSNMLGKLVWEIEASCFVVFL